LKSSATKRYWRSESTAKSSKKKNQLVAREMNTRLMRDGKFLQILQIFNPKCFRTVFHYVTLLP
jgi:hypothetical protein